MGLMVGSARHDEFGGIGNNSKAGDQTGHEVEQQKFYVHSKGWLIFRAKDVEHSKRLASKMIDATNNKNIGYSQLKRNGIMAYGIDTKKPTECDCSSLVRACIFEACGVDVGNFTTQTAPNILPKSGLFKEPMIYTQNMTLWNGDILCTRSKGHIVIVTSGNPRYVETKLKSIDDVAREVIQGKWGVGAIRRQTLTDAGYNYAEVQHRVNELLRK